MFGKISEAASILRLPLTLLHVQLQLDLLARKLDLFRSLLLRHVRCVGLQQYGT